MRIALISPYSRSPMRGNIVTVRRISRFLKQEGVVTVTLAVDDLSVTEMKEHLAEFKPDLIHCFHAHYSGSITRQLAEYLNIPYVVTITGSDLHNSSLRNHPDTVNAIETAQAIVCFHQNDAERLTEFFPTLRGKVSVVPQGVESLPMGEGDCYDFVSEAFVLFLPAALRPVKRVDFAISSLSKLALSDKKLQLVIAGGVIDSDYAESIRKMVSNNLCVTWFGEVPHERMRSLYERADLVLNCSQSESMPNSLMEAMALGRPVLAANISGNRSLVQNGITGWLYDSEADFLRLVAHIRGDATVREEVGRNAKKCIMEYFPPSLEAKRYLALYRELLRL